MSFNHIQQKNDFKYLEGIIFDLDGTLINTEKLKFRTYYDELKFNGIKSEKLRNLKKLYISLVGSTDIDAAKKIFDTYQIKSISNNPIYKSSKPWEKFYQSILKRYYVSHGNEKSLNENRFRQRFLIRFP